MEKMIFPVLRKAEFIHPDRAIDEPTAKKISESLKDIWIEIVDQNIQAIKNVPGVTNVKLQGNPKEDAARVLGEGLSAYVVDNPIIEANAGDVTFKIRVTIAVCYKGTSTKNWTRVSLDRGVNTDVNINRLKAIYNNIASVCCKTNHEIISRLLKNEFRLSSAHIGDFTIMTFGVQDENLGQYLDLFDDPDLKLKELFVHNPKVKKIIQNYFKKLFDKDEHFILDESDDRFWMKTSTSVVGPNGYLDNSNVIFKISLENDSLFAFGLGYDGFTEGDLARLSSLEVARFYSKEI